MAENEKVLPGTETRPAEPVEKKDSGEIPAVLPKNSQKLKKTLHRQAVG